MPADPAIDGATGAELREAGFLILDLSAAVARGLDSATDAQLRAEWNRRGHHMKLKIEDFTDAELLQAVGTRGLEDDVIDRIPTARLVRVAREAEEPAGSGAVWERQVTRQEVDQMRHELNELAKRVESLRKAAAAVDTRVSHVNEELFDHVYPRLAKLEAITGLEDSVTPGRLKNLYDLVDGLDLCTDDLERRLRALEAPCGEEHAFPALGRPGFTDTVACDRPIFHSGPHSGPIDGPGGGRASWPRR